MSQKGSVPTSHRTWKCLCTQSQNASFIFRAIHFCRRNMGAHIIPALRAQRAQRALLSIHLMTLLRRVNLLLSFPPIFYPPFIGPIHSEKKIVLGLKSEQPNIRFLMKIWKYRNGENRVKVRHLGVAKLQTTLFASIAEDMKKMAILKRVTWVQKVANHVS